MSICSPSLSTRSEVSISCAPVELMQSCVEVKCATSWSYLKKAQPSSSPSPGPLRLEYEDEICSHLGPCGGNSGTDVAMLQGRRNLGLWCSSRLYSLGERNINIIVSCYIIIFLCQKHLKMYAEIQHCAEGIHHFCSLCVVVFCLDLHFEFL